MRAEEAEGFTRTTRRDRGGRRATYAGKDTGPSKEEQRAERKRTLPFIAWDGEGYNDSTGHHYSLFGNSLGARVEKPSLDWMDCIRLLMESPKEAYHVIYAGTYDVVMMFRNESCVAELLKGNPVRYKGYRLVYRKSKYLQVTDLSKKGTPEATRTLFDVFTFFRGSFVAACREYGVGDPETLAAVEEMKGQRNDFSGITPDIRIYMGRELSLLVQLCDNLRDRLALANIYPAQWHGPGAIAGEALRTHKVNKCRGIYDQEFRRSAESAYYGGRFEQFQRGTYLGPVYQYDIRSAYPAAMTHLPDLSQVTWHHTEKVTTHDNYGLYRIACSNIPDHLGIGKLPHRNRYGTILFPTWAYGWYWGIECKDVPLRQRTEAYMPSGPGLAARPFAFVSEDYRQRAILKAANQPQQLALKLKLNSLYGKLAQSKGARKRADGSWHYPPFHEIVWAGWITAFTRAAISEAMHSVDPASIIACETDSVFSLEPLPSLTVGTGLGEWEYEVADGLRYIQSGVSLILKHGQWEFKTRGFTVHKSIREVSIWEKFLCENGTLRLKQTRFGTDPRVVSQFGKWYTQDRQLSLAGSPLEKRIHSDCGKCSQGNSFGEAMHPMMIAYCQKGPSVPYRFVWREEQREQMMIADLFTYDDDPELKTEYL